MKLNGGFTLNFGHFAVSYSICGGGGVALIIGWCVYERTKCIPGNKISSWTAAILSDVLQTLLLHYAGSFLAIETQRFASICPFPRTRMSTPVIVRHGGPSSGRSNGRIIDFGLGAMQLGTPGFEEIDYISEGESSYACHIRICPSGHCMNQSCYPWVDCKQSAPAHRGMCMFMCPRAIPRYASKS